VSYDVEVFSTRKPIAPASEEGRGWQIAVDGPLNPFRKRELTVSSAHAAVRIASNWASHLRMRFQLAKFRVIRFPSGHRASGRTRDTSWSRNALDFIKTAKWPPPSIGTNAFAGARMDSTNERARLVGVVKSSAP
jgi:hypothetical protein